MMNAETRQALDTIADSLRSIANALHMLAQAEGSPRPAQESPQQPARQPAPARRGFGEGIDPQPHREPEHAPAFDGVPKNGKALFLWAKSQGEEHGVDLVGELTRWTKSKGWGHQFASLDRSQVEAAYREGLRRIEGVVYA